MREMFAIDPGPTESAYVLLDEDTGTPIRWEKLPNSALLALLERQDPRTAGELVLEMVSSYGMPVGAEVFSTCVWIGRFLERWLSTHRGCHYRLLMRHDVKLHLTHQRNAKDSHIRQALIDRYGPGKDRAVGNKKAPGPLYGITRDGWSALAVAVTALDTRRTDAA